MLNLYYGDWPLKSQLGEVYEFQNRSRSFTRTAVVWIFHWCSCFLACWARVDSGLWPREHQLLRLQANNWWDVTAGRIRHLNNWLIKHRAIRRCRRRFRLSHSSCLESQRRILEVKYCRPAYNWTAFLLLHRPLFYIFHKILDFSKVAMQGWFVNILYKRGACFWKLVGKII